MFLHVMKYVQKIVAGMVAVCAFSGMAMAHEWMAPKQAGEVQNPIPFSAESSESGRQVYLENCATCHGENAEGLMAAKADLTTDTPDLKKRLATHSDGDFFWKIEEGRGEMPSFKGELEAQEIWEVIHYIKALQ
jgi:mono/diheme cytochrome c family protein